MLKHAALAFLMLSTSALAGEPSDLVQRFYNGELSLFNEVAMKPVAGGSLAAFLAEIRDHEAKQDDVMCLDFDPVIDAQDFDEEELKTSLRLDENTSGDGSAVTANFTVFGEPRGVVWSLQKLDGAWRVNDIASDEGGWRISDMTCEPL